MIVSYIQSSTIRGQFARSTSSVGDVQAVYLALRIVEIRMR